MYKSSKLRAWQGRYGLFSAYLDPAELFSLWALRLALPSCSAESPSGLKSHKDDNIHAGDKSPAYLKAFFPRPVKAPIGGLSYFFSRVNRVEDAVLPENPRPAWYSTHRLL